jgi:flagellar biosynthetic protein FlhB
MAGSDQKTEKPTPQRLKKAREEGNFPSARTFVNSMQFLAFVSLLHVWGVSWVHNMQIGMLRLTQSALDPRLRAMDLVWLSMALMKEMMTPIVIMGAVMVGITIAIQLVVTGFGLSLKKVTPDLKRLNPIDKLKQLPSQNLPALLQAIVMLPVFAAAVYFVVTNNLTAYLSLPLGSLTGGVAMVAGSIESLLWKAAGLFLVFGLVDLIRQKARYAKELRMSKQEIRDEAKESEGNPMVKGRIRRLRRDMARKQMMKEIPTATAIIVNPTHYAVALRYSMETKGAPMVVAKGKNYLALRIRQKALDHNIPLIENPPLAQGLYKSVDVGHEIPAHFYRAVAEVLAYIYRVMNGRRPAQAGRGH